MFREGRNVGKKKQAPVRKNASFFPSLVHWFFAKKHRKVMQNAWKPSLCTKIDKKSRVERSFLAKKRFLVNFWGPPGSPGASWDDPGNSQNRSFFSFMVNCDWKRRWTASGRPREGPRGASRRPQGTILRLFSVQFCTSERNKKYKKCRDYAILLHLIYVSAHVIIYLFIDLFKYLMIYCNKQLICLCISSFT